MPLGQVPPSPIPKQPGAAPPQQGMTQYCAPVQVIEPHVMGPCPPSLALAPPVAACPPAPPAPLAPLDPPSPLDPAPELPPAFALLSLAEPLHASETNPTSTKMNAECLIGNFMACPLVQLVCRHGKDGFPQYSDATVPNGCANQGRRWLGRRAP